MEKNTILLDLNEYNELRDFKREIEDGNTYRVSSTFTRVSAFVSTDDAIEEMGNIIKITEEKLEAKEKEINELKSSKEKQLTVDEIKNMSWRKFKKWKKSKL